MSDREAEIVEFFLGLCSMDDPQAEMKTCEKFEIDEQTLQIILEIDLIESLSMSEF